jgi:hypothetical protein
MDKCGRTYRFVTIAELKPVKAHIQRIIKDLHSSMREHGVTFEDRLIGSGGKNLVTQVVDGNTGYDFDYNLAIQKDNDLDAKALRLLFVRTLDRIIAGSGFESVSDGKQSFTIKVLDRKNHRINHSCDFAIVNEYIDEFDNDRQEILVRKLNNMYVWEEKPVGKNHSAKIANLKANGLWNDVRDEYLKIKNHNMDENKRSYTMYYEAVNNVYGRYRWI